MVPVLLQQIRHDDGDLPVGASALQFQDEIEDGLNDEAVGRGRSTTSSGGWRAGSAASDTHSRHRFSNSQGSCSPHLTCRAMTSGESVRERRGAFWETRFQLSTGTMTSGEEVRGFQRSGAGEFVFDMGVMAADAAHEEEESRDEQNGDPCAPGEFGDDHDEERCARGGGSNAVDEGDERIQWGPMDSLLAWRKEFPILGHTTYMISHSLGAMPLRAADSMREYTDTWASRGIRAWEEGWWEMPLKVGNLIGSIIGAGEGEVVMHQNVSVCQSLVTSCLDWSGKRNKLVTEELNFPSNDYIYYGLERIGALVVNAPVDTLLEAIDEETLLVSVSHVAFRNSYVQDLAAIVKRAHDMGAMVIADLYQSAGTVPVNVRALGVDFATGGSVKWLCGGPGAGYLYVRRDLWDKLEPAATGWVAHEQPFLFAGGPIRYAESAYRFMNGTPNVPAMYAARPGYEIINEIGVRRYGRSRCGRRRGWWNWRTRRASR